MLVIIIWTRCLISYLLKDATNPTGSHPAYLVPAFCIQHVCDQHFIACVWVCLCLVVPGPTVQPCTLSQECNLWIILIPFDSCSLVFCWILLGYQIYLTVLVNGWLHLPCFAHVLMGSRSGMMAWETGSLWFIVHHFEDIITWGCCQKDDTTCHSTSAPNYLTLVV